jgi:DNA-binding beta-propeller fold protein YncE
VTPTRLDARASGAALTLAAVLTASWGCGAGTNGSGQAGAGEGAAEKELGCAPRGGTLRPVGEAEQSATVALGAFSSGKLAGKTLAIVADADEESVAVVDLDGKKELASKAVGGTPSQVMILPDGRLLVTVRDQSQLLVLHPAEDATLSRGCAVATKAEPIAMARAPASSAGGTLLVTAGWGRALEAFDLSLSKKASVDLPREPRQVVVADDGKIAFVSHAVGGRMSVVDLETMRALPTIALRSIPGMAGDDEGPFNLARSVSNAVDSVETSQPGEDGVMGGSQGYSLVKSRAPKGRLLVPQVLVNPGDPQDRGQGIGPEHGMLAGTNVTVIDAGTRRVLPTSASAASTEAILLDERGRFGNQETPVAPCILPRGAAVDAVSGTLFVACLGADAVVAYPAASADPASFEVHRWEVGSGPTGLAMDEDNGRLVVWSQFERSVELLSLAQMDEVLPDGERPKRDRIPLTRPKTQPELAVLLGRNIFHSVADIRISSSGLACASCHPDGRDDGMTWSTPQGPRRTVVIAGRLAGSEPYGWTGASPTLEDHLRMEFERLAGQGLKNVQLDALTAYVASLPPPPREAPAKGPLAGAGEELFRSSKTGCNGCHARGGSDKKAHDVGSKTATDRKAAFDTPSLRFLSGRDRFFHDGRFATLRDLLTSSHGKDGKGPRLEPAEVESLEAYLKTL